MKTFFKLTVGFMLVLGMLSQISYAKPESFPIQSEEAKIRHRRAKTTAKNLDLNKVQDPQARLALQTLFDALKLDTKNSN